MPSDPAEYGKCGSHTYAHNLDNSCISNSILRTTMSSNFNLPSYMSLVPTTDPDFVRLNKTAYDPTFNIYNPHAGGGGLREFQVVRFNRDHDAYRLFGGKAGPCGFWWSLAPESDCYNDTPAVSVEEYRSNYAVCPEWNAGTNIQRVTIPAGKPFIVGIGQSVHCDGGIDLEGSPTLLQLNGGVCDIDLRGGNDTCATDWNDVLDSPCVANCSLSAAATQQLALGGDRHRALRGDYVIAAESRSSGTTTSGAQSPYPLSGIVLMGALLVRWIRY